MKARPMGASCLYAVRVLLFLLLAAQLIPVSSGWAKNSEYNLTILHTNDVHARLMELDAVGDTCEAEEALKGECFGGVARRATLIREIRKNDGNFILVDAGDQFQGTLFFTKYKGIAIQRFMNELGYQAMVVGNHEFVEGPAVLADFFRGTEFPVLGSNVDADNEPYLKNLIKPYVVLEVGGERIGILGYTVEDVADISKPGAKLKNRALINSINTALNQLKKMNIDKIIALSHIGFGRDEEIAAQVEGIDVIVGGHTHTLLSNTDPTAEGPYPVVIKSPTGKPVLVVTAFAWGKYLGRLDVTFDANGVLTHWNGEPILLDAAVREDPRIRAEIDKLNQPLLALQQEVIGTTGVDLVGGLFCRFEECNLGNLLTDAMLSATLSGGTRIALMNGGGIRASVSKGEISRREILEVLPFSNTLCTFSIKGEDLLAALENGVSRADSAKNEGTGRFLQVSGLRYSWDPQRPVGTRVITAEVRQADGSYQSIEPVEVYKVAAIDYLRRGGDGYRVFAEKAVEAYDEGPLLSDVFIEYLRTHSPVAPKIEGRIIKTEAGGSKSQASP
ncbi:MAG: bifunctional metallophosphatase/5'-nucleotidase [Desulforhabdus sp.]|nr:bifunctional metallophosphatase/5'-nucleotidase [Desulforhabdus sp.]